MLRGRNNNFRLTLLAMAALVIICPTASRGFEPDLTFSSSPHPVGSGARALGRAGAFIAIADDATAASWNPAGLVQLEFPEASTALSYLDRGETLDFNSSLLSFNDYHYYTAELNYASLVFPAEALPRYMVFALNYQRLYEFNRQLDYAFVDPVPRTSGSLTEQISYRSTEEQDGAFTTLSAAAAIEITYRFSVGLTANLWDDRITPNSWAISNRETQTGTYTLPGSVTPISVYAEQQDYYRLEGTNFNFNLGFLWDINDTWRIAGVYKTELTAKVNHHLEFFNFDYYPTASANTQLIHFKHSYDEIIHLPPSYGLGVAFQPSDEWSIAFDLYRTEWSRYFYESETGGAFNLITGDKGNDGVQATIQAHLGVEYLLIRNRTVIPFRAGLLYDPEPSPESPKDVYGASLGVGYLREPVLLDAAVQYRWGRGLEGEWVADTQSDKDLSELLVMVSMIYHVSPESPLDRKDDNPK